MSKERGVFEIGPNVLTIQPNKADALVRVREDRDAVIEECAIAAHKAILDNGGTFELAHDAMDAIRALKDKQDLAG